MVEIVNLESPTPSPTPSPRSSKKRSHDRPLVGEQVIAKPQLGSKTQHDFITVNPAEGDPEVDKVPERESVEVALGEDKKIKDLLFEALENISETSAGHVATTTVLSYPTNPGLHVKGLGGIGLPLSQNDAHRLITNFDQTYSDKPSQTTDTYDLDSEKRIMQWDLTCFELQNPAWQEELTKTLPKIAADLGIAAGAVNVRAELCKLLLHEEGANCEEHGNSGNAQGTFGTLMITLPSSHKGGNLDFNFNGEQILLETASNSDFGFSYLAWYADAGYSVQDITSGYRFAVVYNLIHDTLGAPPCALNLVNKQHKVVQALQVWSTAQNQKPRYWPLAYTLENQYSKTDLRFDRLQVRDLARARILQQACHEQGFSLFLANVEQVVSGTCTDADPWYYHGRSRGYDRYSCHGNDDHGDEYQDVDEDKDDKHHSIVEESNRYITLKSIVLPDGSEYAQDVDFNIKNILPDEPFGNDPDEEDYDEDCTNYYYRQTCLLIMPHGSQDELLFESTMGDDIKGKELLDTLIEAVLENESSGSDSVSHASLQSCRTRLEGFCKYIMKKSHRCNESSYEDIITAALLLDSSSLFFMVAEKGASDISPSAYHTIGLALLSDVSNPLEWLRGIALAAQSLGKLHKMWERLSAFMQGYKDSIATTPSLVPAGDASLDSVTNWLYSTLKTEFQLQSLEDVGTLVEIFQSHEHHEQFLLKDIVPSFQSSLVKKEFILVFLSSIYNFHLEGHISKETAREVHCEIIRRLMPELLEIGDLEPDSKRIKYTSPSGEAPTKCTSTHSRPPTASVFNNSKPGELARFLGHCLDLGLRDEVHKVLSDIVHTCTFWSVEAFRSIWIPFLREFLIFVSRLPTEEKSEYSYVFEETIENYIRRYLGVEPPKPITKMPIKRGCGCPECRELDEFILNPRRQVGYFRYKESIRDHLVTQLGREYMCETEIFGRPFTLIVTKKNEAESAAKRAVAKYEKRRDNVSSDIKSVGLSALNELLGTNGEDLIDFQSVRNRLIVSGTKRTQLASNPQSINTSPFNPVTSSTKATTDHIDSSEDAAPKVIPKSAPNNLPRSIEKTDDLSRLNKLCELMRWEPGFYVIFDGRVYTGSLTLKDGTVEKANFVITDDSRPICSTQEMLKQTLAKKANAHFSKGP